ncbi:MAG: ABC transporter permease [Treponema sp.]|jgi:peptide/nickel transport system permease protein|nr:ABC transporter permease [Treponema sp.]
MGRYIAGRIVQVLPVLFTVSVLVFALGYLVPGDAAAVILGEGASPEDLAALRERMGLNEAPLYRYFRWLFRVLRGDLGLSTLNGLEVRELIAGRIAPTASLALYSLSVAVLIALPLGIAAACGKGKAADGWLGILALLGISVPGFILGLFLMILFGVWLRWLPVSGYTPLSAGFLPHLRSLTLPALSLGFMYAALLMRMTRSALLDVLGRDYIRTARAKGLGESRVLVRHALVNALPPLITVLAQSFAGLLAGAAVIEFLFGVPGLGSLAAASIGRRDVETLQGIILIAALANIGLSLAADLCLALADPRLRLSGEL